MNSLLSAVIFIEDRKPLQKKVTVVFDSAAAHWKDKARNAACCNDSHAAAEFFLHPVDHAVNHTGGAEHHAAAHGIDGVFADGLFRAFQTDGRQLRRARGERLGRE